MDLSLLKWQFLRGTLLRRAVLRAFMFMMALVVVSVLQMAHDVRVIEPMMPNFDECSSEMGLKKELNLTASSNSGLLFPFPLFGTYKMSNKESRNLTMNVFKELAKKNLLQSNARALCVGYGSAYATSVLQQLNFHNSVAVEKHPFFSILRRKFMYELEFKDNEFDFVFSGDLDGVSVPSLLVSELERVLSPGGTGALIVGPREFYAGGGGRIKSTQIPVVSFLKNSDVLHVCSVGPSALVIFKKRLEAFENFQLPSNCPSVANNEPFMKHIEPVESSNLSYLPKFMNISSRNKLIYMNIGAGEFAKSTITKISEAYGLGGRRSAFEAFIVDHKTSVLASISSAQGFNFVYYPFFSGENYAPEISSDEHLSAPMEEEGGFDFSLWFEETVYDGDFTVLVMNARPETLGILVELFKAGAICHVDELFLVCSGCGKGGKCDSCSNVVKSLRKSGVYAHQWSGD